MYRILSQINHFLWGNGLLVLLLGTGIICMMSGRFAAFRSFRILLQKPQKTEKKYGMSVFQACTTSLAAAMGTGNIAGVATALTLGGAGAVFWMWIAAVTGMALIYAENILACRYRRSGECGAIAYLRHGLQSPKLAAAFAVCCVLASFGMGNMTQTNTMAQTLSSAMDVPPLLTGICAAVVTWLILSGNAGRIGKFTQIAIPVLSFLYLIGAGLVIFLHRDRIPAVFGDIFSSAFGLQEISGGISGAAVMRAVSVGLRRGIFSNEAGLGSSGILHGEANGNPEILGVSGMCEVFADTFLCCTATALTILCTGVMDSGADGGVLVLEAFRCGMGNAADFFLPPITALFGLCTLIGWGYCGTAAYSFLTNGKYIRLFQGIFCLAACIGAVMELEIVWTLADIANAGMAYCNLPALLLLYPEAVRRHTSPPCRIHCTNSEAFRLRTTQGGNYESEYPSCGHLHRRTCGRSDTGTGHRA